MIYYITFLVYYLGGIYNVLSSNKKYVWALFVVFLLWLIFHDGFRWEIATDWDKYYAFFQDCLNSNPEELEVGYVWTNQIVRLMTDDYSIYVLGHAILINVFIFLFIKRYSPYPLFSIFVFYFLMLSYLGMNRQYFAVVICLYSIRFILENKKLPFLISIAIAFLFHKSCIIFLPAYFLNKKFKTSWIVLLLSVSVLISLMGLWDSLIMIVMNFVGDEYMLGKANAYMGRNVRTDVIGMLLGVCKRLIWLFLLLKFNDGIKKKYGYQLIFNIYVVGIAAYLMFNGSLFQIIVDRGIIYYNIMEIVLLAYVITIFKGIVSKFIMCLVLGIYGLIIMGNGFDFYLSYGPDIFIPYRSILFE